MSPRSLGADNPAQKGGGSGMSHEGGGEFLRVQLTRQTGTKGGYSVKFCQVMRLEKVLVSFMKIRPFCGPMDQFPKNKKDLLEDYLPMPGTDH